MKNMENWTRDDYNNWVDNLESVKSVKELNKWIEEAKRCFPDCIIKYKLKDKEEWKDIDGLL